MALLTVGPTFDQAKKRDKQIFLQGKFRKSRIFGGSDPMKNGRVDVSNNVT